jgi:integrase
VVERLKSPGRDERFSIVKTPDFATRVHFFVIRRLSCQSSISKNDKRWFPRWLRRYANALTANGAKDSPSANENLPVTVPLLISFLRSLRDNGVPAWQRLQAVRAIEAYRNLVRQTDEPCLKDIRLKLSRIASQEDHQVQSNTERLPPPLGQIDPSEPTLLQQVRKELRLRRKAPATERAYVGWVRRFMQYCQSTQLENFGESEIKAFLTHLAVDAEVSASTQNQAKSALLFLYQMVLGRELAFLDVTPANKPTRLPVVLSRQEIAKLLKEFVGVKRLMFLTMYGAGLRHGECRRLRVKDLCFDQRHIVVRSGKGDKDRITVLPDSCRDGFQQQIDRVKRLHQYDLDSGLGQVDLPFALQRKYPQENQKLAWQWGVSLPPSFTGPTHRVDTTPPRQQRLLRQRIQDSSRPCRYRQECDSSLATTQFRHPSSGRWCRYQNGSGAARTQGRSNNHDLHPCDEPTRASRVASPADLMAENSPE